MSNDGRAAGYHSRVPAAETARHKRLKEGLMFAISYTPETPLISMGSHVQHEADLSPFSPTLCKLIFTTIT